MGLVVINPGMFTTVQDVGRPGYAAWGVCGGGAFDRGSAELANALLGNAAGCAVLEMTLVGGTYQGDGPLAMALGGCSDRGEDRHARSIRAGASSSVEFLASGR